MIWANAKKYCGVQLFVPRKGSMFIDFSVVGLAQFLLGSSPLSLDKDKPF